MATFLNNYFVSLKCALSGLRQFLVPGSSLKMVNNAFYFTLKALFVLKSVNICLDFLVIHKNSLIRKIRLFQNLDVTNSEANNYNTHIGQYLKNKRHSDN